MLDFFVWKHLKALWVTSIWYKSVQNTILYLATSAARSAAEVTKSVCGVPTSLDAEERDCAFMPVKFMRKVDKWARSLVSCHDEVSENACSS